MSTKRQRGGSGRAVPPASKAKGRGRLLLLAATTLALVAGGVWLTSRKVDLHPVPQVVTTSLDASAAKLIEQRFADVRKDPRSGAAWGRLGAALRSFEFRDEARLCLENAEKLEPSEPRWPHLLGLLLANHSPTDAAAAFRRAVGLCGNEPPASRLRLARLLAESGQWPQARNEFAELTRVKPDFAPALLGLAQCAQALGEPQEALALANRSTSDRSTARAAWSLVATLQQRLGDTNAARLAGQRAAALPVDAPVADAFEGELSPVRSDPRDLSDRAQRFLQAGRVEEAAPLVQQLAREHPQFAESWLLLGRWQLLGRNAAAAETSTRRHLELDPRSVNGVFQLGSALLAQNRFEEAAVAFRQATQLKADFGPAFYNLGFALAKSGRTREAVAPFREAIRHNPERVDSYVLLADLYVQLGEMTEAAALARQAEAVAPNDRRLPALWQKIGRR
jgi:tetratricopeptide (TPR) repeat protein